MAKLVAFVARFATRGIRSGTRRFQHTARNTRIVLFNPADVGLRGEVTKGKTVGQMVDLLRTSHTAFPNCLNGTPVDKVAVSVLKEPKVDAVTKLPGVADAMAEGNLVLLNADTKLDDIRKLGGLADNMPLVFRITVPMPEPSKLHADWVPVGPPRQMAIRLTNALPKAVVTLLPANCMLVTLQPDDRGRVSWPGMDSNQLFVRSLFHDFFNHRLHQLDHARFKATLLRGVPGIGKSTFGIYTLWRGVTEGRSLIYQYAKEVKGQELVYGDTVNSVRIVDGLKPEGNATKTLLISSPRGGDAGPKGIYHEFSKDAKQTLFMPLPNDEELEVMRTTCFPTVPAADVKERVSRWGNVPRWVLDNVDQERRVLETSILEQDARKLDNFAKQPTESAALNISFRLLHYVINEDYTKVESFQWATRYVEQRVWDRIRARSEDEYKSMLTLFLRDKGLLPMCTAQFEELCTTTLTGGSGKLGFRIRRLGIGKIREKRDDAVKGKSAAPKKSDNAVEGKKSDDAVEGKKKDDKAADAAAVKALLEAADAAVGISTDADGVQRLALPTAKQMRLDNVTQLREWSPDGKSFWRGGRKNFAAVDFVTASGICANTTVSAEHELLLQGMMAENGLRAIIEQLNPKLLEPGCKEPIPFLWLLPTTKFKEELKPGPIKIEIKSKAGDAAVVVAKAIASRVVQYAVEMPDPSLYHDLHEVKKEHTSTKKKQAKHQKKRA